MVFLRITVLVVDFLSNQKQDPAASEAVVSFHTLNEHVVVCHNDRIQACLDGSLGNILMRSGSI